MSTHFRKIAIFGVGLIGGSIGLALRKAAADIHILGVGRNKERLLTAKNLGAIDDYLANPVPDLRDRDLVILATPVDHILVMLEKLGASLGRNAVVTDVGSTKRLICEKAWASLPESVEFIGGHPIAGREVYGVENGSADLFHGAPYVFCSKPGHDGRSVEKLCDFASSLGAIPSILTAEEHDTILARVSHLPQLIATALAGMFRGERVDISGSGLRDMIRLAGSPYSVWESIFSTNQDNVDQALEDFIGRLEEMREALRSNQLADEFGRAGEVFRNVRRKEP